MSDIRRSAGALNRRSVVDIDEIKQEAIWKAFGGLVAKELRLGRGVWIPKFGHFSFTATAVDLAGSTNPDLRNH
jgi:hypothetical protein